MKRYTKLKSEGYHIAFRYFGGVMTLLNMLILEANMSLPTPPIEGLMAGVGGILCGIMIVFIHSTILKEGRFIGGSADKAIREENEQ